jgi:hypothetical protein
LVREDNKLSLSNIDGLVHPLRILGPKGWQKETQLNYQGQEQRMPLGTAGFYQITCSRHPWESAAAVVADSPYYAVTDEKGAFELAEIPPGEYLLVVWHDSMRMEKVMRNGLVADYRFPAGLSVSFKVTLAPNEERTLALALSARDEGSARLLRSKEIEQRVSRLPDGARCEAYA